MAKNVINVKILGDNKDLSRALGGARTKISSFASFGTAALAGVTAAAGGVAVGAFKIGDSFDKQYDKIRIGTGATGDALEGLQDSFKNVLGSSGRGGFDEAGSAIADLNTRLGLTGKPLENLSTQFINLSSITGTDLPGNIDKMTRVFGDWEIQTGNQGAALDEIYRAAQASGIGLEELSGSVVQFGAPLRNLGFGFDESLALLAQFNKTGVNTETVFSGLRQGIGRVAKEGEDVPTTFRRIVAEIQALGPGSEATGLAIDLFGQRAGPDLADAIASGKFAVDDMLAAITDGSDTINQASKDTESFGQKWQRVKNRVLVKLEPIAIKVFEGIGKAMDDLGPYVEQMIAWFEEKIPPVVAKLRAWFEENWPRIRAAIEQFVTWFETNVWPTIQSIMEGIQAVTETVIAIVSAIWDRWGEDISRVAKIAMEYVKTTIENVLKVIRGIVDTITGLITGDWDKAWSGIRDIFGGVWDQLKTIVETTLKLIKAALSLAWDEIKRVASDAWAGLKSTVSNALDDVVGFVSGLPGRLLALSGDLVGAAVGLGTDFKDGLVDLVQQMAADVVRRVRELPDTIRTWAFKFLDAGKELGRQFVDGVVDAIGAIVDFAGDIASGIIDAFKAGWNTAAQTINDFIPDKISIPFAPDINLPNNPLPTFHDGGPVGNMFGPARDVPIMAQQGEWVLSRDDVREFLGSGGPRLPESLTVIIEGRPLRAAIVDYQLEESGRL